MTGPGLRATRRGLAASPDLLRVERDGGVLAVPPEPPDRLPELRDQAVALHLLPGFDEILLGHEDRAITCPTSFAEAVCSGNDGMSRHTVVVDGQVAGTRRKGTTTRRGPQPVPVVTWLREPSGSELEELAGAAPALPR